MNYRTHVGGVISGVFSLALILGACGGDEAPEEAASTEASESTEESAPRVTLTEEETARIPTLTSGIRNGSYTRSVLTKENAKIFLYLAETSGDANVIVASLGALPRTWTHSSRFEDRFELVTPEFCAIVLERTADESNVVQAAAIEASARCIQGDAQTPEVVNRLVELATSHPTPAGKHAAMEVLWNSSTIRDAQEQIAPYVAALDASEPWLVSGALFRLSSFGRGWSDQAGLRSKLRALLQHSDPGVRGRAALALAAVSGARDPERDAIARSIMPLLGDSHPFPKSAAANALSTLDYRPAIHTIVTLLDDQTGNTYDITGYQELSGASGRTHHDGSAWSRVSDAALNALKSFSFRVGERFDYRINYQQIEQDLAAATATARAWYESVRADIPQP